MGENIFALKDQIELAKDELKAINNTFDMVTDPDLIDACIYQMLALENRIKSLYKQARKDEAQSSVS
jgi:hypothetical protein